MPKEYTRRRSGSVNDVIPEGTPTEIIEHRLSEEERICEECGTVMEEIGHEVRYAEHWSSFQLR